MAYCVLKKLTINRNSIIRCPDHIVRSGIDYLYYIVCETADPFQIHSNCSKPVLHCVSYKCLNDTKNYAHCHYKYSGTSL